MKIVKFGGSSLADAAHFQKVIDIISSDNNRRVVVTSAPGKRFTGDIKVTDLLITYANKVMSEKPYADIQNQIFNRYEQIGDAFNVSAAVLTSIHDKLLSLPNASYPNNDYLMAAFKAHGERLNAELFAACLTQSGIPANSSIQVKPALFSPMILTALQLTKQLIQT
ncbi:aspartokinase [Lentilactobacillus kosonis]|uniref:Aspartokinase n=1 Tax=Lentilactobacillus kosonis TaxID=2810561 RepID=A0A401FMA9_9LACO|nr:aspartokinase [Lentilactobacillus kosonis]